MAMAQSRHAHAKLLASLRTFRAEGEAQLSSWPVVVVVVVHAVVFWDWPKSPGREDRRHSIHPSIHPSFHLPPTGRVHPPPSVPSIAAPSPPSTDHHHQSTLVGTKQLTVWKITGLAINVRCECLLGSSPVVRDWRQAGKAPELVDGAWPSGWGAGCQLTTIANFHQHNSPHHPRCCSDYTHPPRPSLTYSLSRELIAPTEPRPLILRPARPVARTHPRSLPASAEICAARCLHRDTIHESALYIYCNTTSSQEIYGKIAPPGTTATGRARSCCRRRPQPPSPPQ